MNYLRRVVTGVGPDGRSTVLKDGEPATVFRFDADRGSADPHDLDGAPSGAGLARPADGGFVMAELWGTAGGEAGGSDPDDATDQFNVECPPGGTRWRIVTFGSYRTSAKHRTKTIDYDVVLSGSVDLVLEDGEVHLEPGDVVVLPAIVHQWRTNESPCTMAVTMVGVGS